MGREFSHQLAPRPTLPTTRAALPAPGVYAITPDDRSAEAVLARVDVLLEHGLRLLQLRRKYDDTTAREALGVALLLRCRAAGVPLIVNDDVDLAERLGADGVHLGKDDGDIAAARTRLGTGATIGASCYDDPGRAEAARRAGADYVAFGAFFPSRSKPNTRQATTELLRGMPAHGLPTVAIGGITPHNAAPLVKSGARWLAVISALWDAPDPVAAMSAFNTLFRSHYRNPPSP